MWLLSQTFLQHLGWQLHCVLFCHLIDASGLWHSCEQARTPIWLHQPWTFDQAWNYLLVKYMSNPTRKQLLKWQYNNCCFCPIAGIKGRLYSAASCHWSFFSKLKLFLLLILCVDVCYLILIIPIYCCGVWIVPVFLGSFGASLSY